MLIVLWFLQQLATTYSGKPTLRNLLSEEIQAIQPCLVCISYIFYSFAKFLEGYEACKRHTCCLFV